MLAVCPNAVLNINQEEQLMQLAETRLFLAQSFGLGSCHTMIYMEYFSRKKMTAWISPSGKLLHL